MVSASIEIATAMVEAGAASVGAGMVLGGFVGGGVGLLRQWPRPKLEAGVLTDGYTGGFALAIDLIVRYAV
jgi:hypothetical protein